MFRDRCRHFNGIQNKTCTAGVAYDSVTGDGGALRVFPCLDVGKGTSGSCALRSLLTQEEHTEQVRELEAAAKALSATASGKCHVCGADAEPSRVVGRCKYAACGHRVGQVQGGP